jgi:hypothetical protein
MIGSVHGPSQPTGMIGVGVMPPDTPTVVGNVPMIVGPATPPPLTDHTAPPGPVTGTTTPLLGEVTILENVTGPEAGAVKVIGPDVGGTMLKLQVGVTPFTSVTVVGIWAVTGVPPGSRKTN